MDTEIYILIGQSVIYILNCAFSTYLLFRFNKNVTEKLDKLNRSRGPNSGSIKSRLQDYGLRCFDCVENDKAT